MSQAKTTETMDRLTHTPTTNDVYKDARNGTLKRIYIDSEIVFTRSEKTKRNRNRHVHNMMDVDTLKNRIDQDRLEHKPDADPDIPNFDPKYADTDSSDLPTKADTNGENTKGENNTVNTTDQQNSQASSSSISETNAGEDENDKVKWKEIALIGEKTQERLYENGYTTYSDVKSASSDELINLKGIGEKAAKNLKTHVENA